MTQVRRIPSRADGIANREKLLDAAETYFAQHGLDAPLHGVAELAGVGTGTLYRNFASQDELVEALFERIDSTFAKVASEASAQRNGWRALETFLRQTVAFLVDNPDARTEIAARMVTLMLDGMRAHPHAPTALPVGADQI